MFRKLILLIISMVSVFSTGVFAVGLGEYQLKSALNQPFDAKLKLLSVGELGEHELHASIASQQEFEKVGIERLFFLNDIRFETVRDDSGEINVTMSTREPVKEPFLNFLVELNWPNGRIIREYTFLLDPPVFDETVSSAQQAAQSSAIEDKFAQTSFQAKPELVEGETHSGSTYGPISSGDTLWGIASKARPNSKVSIHQTLVAIYQANPHAFINGNINNLSRGEVLQIPDFETINQVPHRAALQDVVNQNRNWRTGGSRKIVDKSSAVAESKSVSTQARLSLAAPEDTGTESSSQATSGSEGALEVSQVKEELVKSQEISATLQAENEELRARLADVLQKLEEVQKELPVTIADAELTALTQADSEQLVQAEANDEAVGDESESEISEDVSGKLDSYIVESEGSLAEAEDITLEEEGSEASSSPAVEQPIPKAEKDLLTKILDAGSVTWGAAILVALLIVMAVFWRMRKRMQEEDFQDDLVASAGAGYVDTTETFELPNVGDDILAEIDMEEEPQQPEAEDENFDPLGEADIYIAYGKYEQAEKLLLDSIEDNPIRSDFKVKLMECYAETENRDKFDVLAEEVSQAVDADEWKEQIDSLRQQAWGTVSSDIEDEFDLPSTEDIFGDDEVDFDDELEAASQELISEPVIEDVVIEPDSDSEQEKSPEPESEIDLAADELVLDDIEDLSEDLLDEDIDEGDFNLDAELDEAVGIAEEGEDISSNTETQILDALEDKDSIYEEKGETLEEIESELENEADEPDEGFSLDLDDGSEFDLDMESSTDDSLKLEEDFSFDEEDELADEGGDSEDEISTKLDLARAYIDMGDSDGAKEILQEVLDEGTEQQKEEAQTLLDKAD